MKKVDLKNGKISGIYFSYSVPAVIAACIFSAYSLADSVFVSRMCGPSALSAVEICYPLLCVFSCVSVVIGTGGNVLCGIAIGKGEQNEANDVFSEVTLLITSVSLIFALTVIAFTKRFALILGADGTVIGDVCSYLFWCGCFAPFYMLSGWLFLASETAGKPGLAMISSVVSSLGNILLDWLFVVVLKRGVSGASLASGISAALGAMIPLCYFLFADSTLRFQRVRLNIRRTGHMIYNGLSEGVSAVSTGIIAFIYNIIIMKTAGSSVLADFTVALTLINFFGSLLIGASQGIAPMVSVNFGARNYDRIKKAMKIFIGFGMILSVAVSVFLSAFHNLISNLFKLSDGEMSGYIINAYIPVLVLSPISVIIISYFTAIDKAGTSALLSVARTLILRAIIIFAMLRIFGLNGVWFAAGVSEALSLIINIIAYVLYNKHYETDNVKNIVKSD